MVRIGEKVSRRIKIIPEKFVIVETYTFSYVCQKCQKKDCFANIVSPKDDVSVIPGSCAIAEAIACIAAEKFVMYSPLYRQEQRINRAGIPLSRQTMLNWLLKSSELYFEPLWQRMRQKLLQEDILHADETELQVLHEPDRKAQTKSFMWLYRTGKETKEQLILYDCQKTRNSKHPISFLKGFSGYLHTNGYSAYREPAGRCSNRWMYGRRYFYDAVSVLPEKMRKESPVWHAIDKFDSLFELEKDFTDLAPNERKEMWNKLAVPILNSFHDWVSRLKAVPKSLIGKVIYYVMVQWPWLTAYLKGGRLEISNNRAERSIKPFVMRRKNFLFANPPRGTRSSAIIYSLIETAKENNLDPYRYLTWILKTAPTLNMNNPDQVDRLFPANAPALCLSSK